MSSTLGSLGQVGVVLYDDIAQAHSARLRDTRATRKVGRLRARSGHHRGAPELVKNNFVVRQKVAKSRSVCKQHQNEVLARTKLQPHIPAPRRMLC